VVVQSSTVLRILHLPFARHPRTTNHEPRTRNLPHLLRPNITHPSLAIHYLHRQETHKTYSCRGLPRTATSHSYSSKTKEPNRNPNKTKQNILRNTLLSSHQFLLHTRLHPISCRGRGSDRQFWQHIALICRSSEFPFSRGKKNTPSATIFCPPES